MTEKIRVALAGNPNSGKTTIFNSITGSRYSVGNYPGVTVEQIAGEYDCGGQKVSVVDLPGTYSLTAYSQDEMVARNYVLNERPDLVVCVVDASNLERNLYLVIQLMELRLPLLIAFNKMDAAKAGGLAIDTARLSSLLGVPIVETVAAKDVGLSNLKRQIVEVVAAGPGAAADIVYGSEIEEEIALLQPMVEAIIAGDDIHNPRWVTVKLLEEDDDVMAYIRKSSPDCSELLAAIDLSIAKLSRHFGDAPSVIVPDRRYGFVSGACQESVKLTVDRRHEISDKIDEIVTLPYLGIVLFLGAMFLLFLATFILGAAPVGWIESGIALLTDGVNAVWPSAFGETLRSLVVDGIIGGVGGVLYFIPNIMILFAAVAFLEDSGYMARGAFIMDRFMHRIGLHGRSFIPAMVGFGCTVPAILATRALRSRRERMTTMMVLPLISCGARFPIYTLFIGAFFPGAWNKAVVLMIMYVLGIALAAVLAKLLRLTVFKGESSEFVMELPPYRMPTMSGILSHTWERGRHFLKKAGTVIVLASVILWVMTNYPAPPSEDISDMTRAERNARKMSSSAAGRIGKGMEPVMRHVGFDWRTSTALIGAFAAKEIFVAQLGVVYALEEGEGADSTLRDKLKDAYTPLQAFCIMIFCLISVPCVATIVATRQESGAWKWAVMQLLGLTFLAYVVTFIVYQGGLLLRLGV